ncbi:hypothetical protein NHX12_028023 [Muraenolepis orangiensis]|uniref:Uncharacterized protein n=1 Tax=Muraenolepis orangiensis TaxID=630683 RepID=A0A9Q0IPT5_9TELE|nr:hypothetical protein NHX12_028023 [Muraenolepis orangiensis]
MEEGLNEDMGTLVAYLRRWRLQLSVGKSVAAAYHLSTREARRELEVRVDNKCPASPEVSWSASGSDIILQTSPGRSQGKGDIQGRTDPPPRWNNLGSLR